MSDIDFPSSSDDLTWLDSNDVFETTAQLAQPKLFSRRDQKRQFVTGLKREALDQLIPSLPSPDVEMYIIGNGAGAEQKRGGINPLAFDFGSFVPHLIKLLGDKDCTVYISTWTALRGHLQTLSQLLADGRIKKLTFCTDPSFKRRELAMCSEFIISNRALGDRFRFLAWLNHVKCIAIANADETKFCTITGSANLSAQPRCEQYNLTTDPDVYRFFRDEFFEHMIMESRK